MLSCLFWWATSSPKTALPAAANVANVWQFVLVLVARSPGVNFSGAVELFGKAFLQGNDIFPVAKSSKLVLSLPRWSFWACTFPVVGTSLAYLVAMESEWCPVSMIEIATVYSRRWFRLFTEPDRFIHFSKEMFGLCEMFGCRSNRSKPPAHRRLMVLVNLRPVLPVTVSSGRRWTTVLLVKRATNRPQINKQRVLQFCWAPVISAFTNQLIFTFFLFFSLFLIFMLCLISSFEYS